MPAVEPMVRAPAYTPRSTETLIGNQSKIGDQTDADKWQSTLCKFYEKSGPTIHRGWRHEYYHRIQQRLAHIIEPHTSVLDIGCGCGDLLASLKPSVGVGIDFSPRAVRIAQERHPQLNFRVMRGEDVHKLGMTFDYVIICQTLGEVYDLQELLSAVRQICHARTRVIIVHYNRLWQPVLRFAEWLGIKTAAPEQNWLPSDEVAHLQRLSGFETLRTFGMTIAPLRIPLLSSFLNRIASNLPIVGPLGLSYVTVARCTDPEVSGVPSTESVSVIVPARNEAGHIKPLLERIPVLSKKQEVIFVEGGSSDNTWEVILKTIRDYDGSFKVSCLRQQGKGKGDAVRTGFAAATGDILIILDADISVPPEELPRFVKALRSSKGEFINGSRMVYLMDRKAMRFLNLLGNKLFGWVFTYLVSQRFRDTLCGTKVLTRSDYLRIVGNRSYFGNFDPFGDFDLLFGAARLNLKIVDMPVHYKARTYGETNISRFRHGMMLLRMCGIAAGKLKFI